MDARIRKPIPGVGFGKSWLAVSCCWFAWAYLLAAPLRADDPGWAVFVMKVDGSQVRKLAVAADHDDHSVPRWSHDGKRVVFDAAHGARGARNSFVVNADGSGLRTLGSYARPDWSPDDKQIVLEDYTPKGLEIYVQNLDGQGQTLIASGVCARWSPDGSQLAVTDHKTLRVIDLLSGAERSLFDEPLEDIFAGYNWSPDGKWLAVSARPKPGVPRQLLIVSAQGASQGLRVRREGEQGGSVSFSPDGKRLVFDDGYQIRTVGVEGTDAPRLVAGQQGKNKDPHWSPDGQWIVFCSDREAP